MLKGQNQFLVFKDTLSLDLHTCQRVYLHICCLWLETGRGRQVSFPAYSRETGSPSEPGAWLAASKAHRSFCLSSPGVTGLSSHAWVFKWVPGT